jgi:Recombinase-like helix-turn-helix domain
MTSGTNPGGHTAKSHPTSRRGRAERALRHAADLAPTIKGIQAAGITSLNGIARALNQRSVPTARKGKWTAVQVRRVLARLH